MTEELEEQQTETIYNEYKFLSQEEVDKLKANDLVGTKFLQSYLHGFVMKAKLYNKLKEKAQPFDYQAYKEEQIKQKLNKELLKDKIISTNKKVKAKVNQKLIENISQKETASSRARKELLADDRFKDLLEDKDFEKDETHEAYILRNPSASANAKKMASSKKRL